MTNSKLSLNLSLSLILLLSVLLRLAAALYLGDHVVDMPGAYDQISYYNLALRLLDGHGFTFDRAWWPMTAANQPTAHWSYLYTFYLAAVYALFGPHPLAARLIQAGMVGVLHPWLVWRLGRRLFDERVGLAAAGLTAVYVYFFYYAGALMTEAFYIVGILWVLDTAIRIGCGSMQMHADGKTTDFLPRITRISMNFRASKRTIRNVSAFTGANLRPILRSVGEQWLWLELGLSISVTVLLRQLFLLFVPFLLLWLWFSLHRRGAPVRHLVVSTSVLVVILALCILPFTAYNYVRFQRFVPLNTNAGYAFFWANHPIYGSHFEPILPPEMGSYQDLIPPELHHLDEAALDQALLRRGVQFVLDDPIRYARLSLSRIPAYFEFWPTRQSSLISNISRVGSFGVFLPFMLAGLLLAKSRTADRSAVILLLTFASIYTTIHLLSWALIRYRLPVDAVLLIFAGVAVAGLAERIGQRRSSHVATTQACP